MEFAAIAVAILRSRHWCNVSPEVSPRGGCAGAGNYVAVRVVLQLQLPKQLAHHCRWPSPSARQPFCGFGGPRFSFPAFNASSQACPGRKQTACSSATADARASALRRHNSNTSDRDHESTRIPSASPDVSMRPIARQQLRKMMSRGESSRKMKPRTSPFVELI